MGGQARATGPTLTWTLCGPSRQAEIKVTGVSLVGLPQARTPRDPAAPTSLHASVPGPSGSRAKQGAGTGAGPCLPPSPRSQGPVHGVPGLLWKVLLEPSLRELRPGPRVSIPARSPKGWVLPYTICKMDLALSALTGSGSVL